MFVSPMTYIRASALALVLALAAACTPAEERAAVGAACQAAHVLVHHLCDVRSAGGEEVE